MEEGNQYKIRGHETELLYQIKTEERKAGRCISLSFIQGHIYTRRGGSSQFTDHTSICQAFCFSSHSVLNAVVFQTRDFLSCYNYNGWKLGCYCCCKHFSPGQDVAYCFISFGWICEVDYDNSSIMEIRRYESPSLPFFFLQEIE